MVFLPKDFVMSAEEAANIIKVAETDPYNEDWNPDYTLRHEGHSVSLKTNEKFSDHYDLYENLGEGKFGKVYRCVERTTKLELAAKCIRLKRDADKKQVEKEVSFMTRMHHKCIAQIYDAFATSTNEVILIMEIVQGGELFDRVVEENYILTETAVAMIVYQICEAIRYIHSHNIIHLDLKPENIMCVSQTGNQIKLIDFGLAQYYDGEHDLLFMAGTPEFAAPEVIKFEPLDFHTDMWSVGVIVYILLSGESPFLGDNLALTYFNVERGLWEFCEEFDENGVSEEAKDFITKLLILDKSKRMLPADCLQHPWILHHRERARQIALDNKEDDGNVINKTKLRSYVKNKNFRRLVFGVLFVNTIVRMFNTLKEKNSESGMQYVQTMLNAVNEKEGTNDGPSLMKAAMMAKRKRQETIIDTQLSNEELPKSQRLDSGLGEGSTKVSAVEEDINIIELNDTKTDDENNVNPEKITEESSSNTETLEIKKRTRISSKNLDNSGNEITKPKKVKKIKKISSKASQDSALSPLQTVPIVLNKEAIIVNDNKINEDNEARDNLSELRVETSTVTSLSTTTNTTTTTTTTASEDETTPKVKKVIRRKKAPKPVLTLRDVEVPVVKYAEGKKKIVKKVKKKSSDTILDSPNKTEENLNKSVENESFKNEKNTLENIEMQPIQTLITKRRSSTEKRGGLVGNLLAKLEQKQEQSKPVQFAVSGVVPVTKKLPDGLPKPPLWTAACDVLKINGKDAKIERIDDNSNNSNKVSSKIEIPVELERKVVSEKRLSIKNQNLKKEKTVADDNLQASEKSNSSKCEVHLESTTKISHGDNNSSSNNAKALITKEITLNEKEKSEIESTKIKQLNEKSIDLQENVDLNTTKMENGKKISNVGIKFKDKEENKIILSSKTIQNDTAGAIILENKKTHDAQVNINEKLTNTKLHTQQRIVSSTKPPKPPSDKVKKKKKTTNPKNKSMDDLVNEEEPKKLSKNEEFSDNSKEIPKEQSIKIIQKTQSTGNLYGNHIKKEDIVLLEKTISSTQSLDEKPRKKSLLDPEEIEQIQAQERDAFSFNNLKVLLERRVSGETPANALEEWKKQKTEEVRNSLHDSVNIKRAMKKWISMDKQNENI